MAIVNGQPNSRRATAKAVSSYSCYCIVFIKRLLVWLKAPDWFWSDWLYIASFVLSTLDTTCTYRGQLILKCCFKPGWIECHWKLIDSGITVYQHEMPEETPKVLFCHAQVLFNLEVIASQTWVCLLDACWVLRYSPQCDSQFISGDLFWILRFMSRNCAK